ncbi:zinc finger protein 235-like [Sarcoptes scabiei]|nr:zinc finger protein 235-like [Sarcoptes scabiei]
MAFAIYLRYRGEFQPEPPQILERNLNDPSVKFTCVDFVPSVIKRSGTVIPQFQVEYHSFNAIVEVANRWLIANGPVWEVVNCETIIILYKYNDCTNCYELKPNDCCFYIYGSEKNNILRALRIWIRKRSQKFDPSIEAQKINYKDFFPYYKPNVSDQFEDLDDVIERINHSIENDGINGRIISIESIAFDANFGWEIDPQTTLSTISNKNVFIVRVFFEENSCLTRQRDQIGVEDFHPRQLSRATFFKCPRFESFDQVIQRASKWLRRNPRKLFLNAQSIDIKVKSREKIFFKWGEAY